VVKNQGNNERQQTLEQRDANEEQFFLESSWKEVPENQRGIKALRKTPKEMLWTHIRRELPGLDTEVQERIAFVKAGCAAAERSRATARLVGNTFVRLPVDSKGLSGRLPRGLTGTSDAKCCT
jgi:hypothetical protein